MTFLIGNKYKLTKLRNFTEHLTCNNKNKLCTNKIKIKNNDNRYDVTKNLISHQINFVNLYTIIIFIKLHYTKSLQICR